MKKSLALILVLSSMALADDTLEDAFKNGKASGDISVYYESRHVDSGVKSTYFNNTAWAIGSVGLKYETDFYKNFKAVVGFRGSAPIYEDDKNFLTGHGTGDSTERIYEDNRVMFSKLYLEYNAYDTVIRVGRQDMSADWVSKVNDGISITNSSMRNLSLDALWSRSRGKVQLNEMFKVKKINKDRGVFAAGATYKFDFGLSLRAYGVYADNLFLGIGTKAMYDANVNDNVAIGGMLHYAKTDEEKDIDDGKVFEATAYAKYKDIKFTFGYAQSGKKNGWGSFNLAGDKIVWFEEGDVMYERDTKTYYGMVSFSIEKLSVTSMYGTTSYKLKGGDDTSYRQDEFSTWLSYPIMNNLNAILTFDKTFKAQPGYPSMTQVSAGLSYTF